MISILNKNSRICGESSNCRSTMKKQLVKFANGLNMSYKIKTLSMASKFFWRGIRAMELTFTKMVKNTRGTGWWGAQGRIPQV